ncbi:MAG: NADH-quinone oxidoreductase subunit C [Planctomycetota bacterium]
MASVDEIVAALRARFPDLPVEPKPLLDDGQPAQHFIRIEPENLRAVLSFLRDDGRTRFDQLSDLACVDYLDFPDARDRYGVVYSLLSTTFNHRLWVKCFVNDPEPKLPSVVSLWQAANWMEREAYDMFGVVFEGHPDLRRILTWDGFEAHPLRKDYPLHGKGERQNFEVVKRDSA